MHTKEYVDSFLELNVTYKDTLKWDNWMDLWRDDEILDLDESQRALRDLHEELNKHYDPEDPDYGACLHAIEELLQFRALTPSEYVRKYVDVSLKIDDNITIEKFDETIADGYNLWNYPIEEWKYTQENEIPVELVSFDGEYRLAETKQ